MKKFLSVFFSVLFAVFGICSTNISYANTNENMGISSKNTEKLTAKEESTIKKHFHLSDEQFNGIRNIVDHPFAILFRAGWLSMLGGILGSLLKTIGGPLGATIGGICGATSLVLDLYVDGYENGYKKC